MYKPKLQAMQLAAIKAISVTTVKSPLHIMVNELWLILHRTLINAKERNPELMHKLIAQN